MTSANHLFLFLGTVFFLSSCDVYYPDAPMRSRPGYALNQRPHSRNGGLDRDYPERDRPRYPTSRRTPSSTTIKSETTTTTTVPSTRPRPPVRRDVSAEDWRPSTNPTLEDSAPLPPDTTPREPKTPSTGSSDVPYARSVPGKPGHVYVPDSEGREIDVTGLKSGSKAMDPDTKTIFRVP